MLRRKWSRRAGNSQHDERIAKIVHSVDLAIRQIFPEHYFGLGHAYAVVGSNVASIILEREFRPVAGLAVIDCGAGAMMRLVDNDSFSRPIGGAYHCWIESCPYDDESKELLDIPYKHNETYAKAIGMQWKHASSNYLWGNFKDFVLDGELHELPNIFPSGKLWLKETPEGARWISAHLAEHEKIYTKLTALALNWDW